MQVEQQAESTTMNNTENLKNSIKDKYNLIAAPTDDMMEESCCGSSCGCGGASTSDFSEDYTGLEGYHPNADLGLGCGLPTLYANIREGNTVIDLGSGAGNDAFVAREMVGANGKVIGIDMAENMIDKARMNAGVAGYNNVEFRLGELEKLPVADKTADVILSNCVMNLVPEKEKAFAEAFRVLKHHGNFCISDVVTIGKMPKGLKEDAELYAGCVAGAMPLEDYMQLIRNAGFENVEVKDLKPVPLPDAMLRYYLPDEEIRDYRDGEYGLYSLTVYGEKPCCRKGKDEEEHHHHEHAHGEDHACACGGHH